MRKLIKVLSVLIVCVLVFTNVFALSINDVDKPFKNKTGSITDVDDAVKTIWATVVTIVQILSVAAVVFAGLRYMFASADTKADIKRSMGILAIGAILVFASTTLLGLITKAVNDVVVI